MSWVALGGALIAACVAFATHGASARLVGRNHTQGQHTDAQAATGSYRPDESQIAAVRVGTGNPPSRDIIVMDPSGRQRHILVRATGREGIGVAVARLAWSPDGHWLVFTGVVGRQANRVEEPTTDLFIGSCRRIWSAPPHAHGFCVPARMVARRAHDRVHRADPQPRRSQHRLGCCSAAHAREPRRNRPARAYATDPRPG